MTIICAHFDIWGYGPSLTLWWWQPKQASYGFEIHRRYFSWQIGRVELDVQWL